MIDFISFICEIANHEAWKGGWLRGMLCISTQQCCNMTKAQQATLIIRLVQCRGNSRGVNFP